MFAKLLCGFTVAALSISAASAHDMSGGQSK
jgi:hypothetical protein